MKFKIRAMTWLVALLTGVSIGALALPAAAASSYSSWGNFGSNYQGRSILDSGIKAAGAQTKVNSGSGPAGWLGARGLLYKQSTGALCRDAGWHYNSVAASSWPGGYTSGYCGSGAYQSYSVTRGWESSGSYYSEYWANITPALNF